MNIKNIALGLLTIAVLGLGLSSITRKETVVSVPQGQKATLGSITGPDITSPYLAINGVRSEYRRSALIASTTPCALQSPNATSSYAFTSVQVTTASSTATTWTAARALTAFATTTQLGQFSLSSAVLGSMYIDASSTLAVDGGGILPPNTWIVWGVAGTAIADTTKLNGVCQAEFLVVS